MEKEKANESREFAQSEQKKIISDIVKVRKEKEISQKKLGELSGVQQPVIARMETGEVSPKLETVLKVINPLGKTLILSSQKESGGEQ